VSQTIEVRVPDLGNFSDVAVIDVLVKVGDSVAVDTPLRSLNSASRMPCAFPRTTARSKHAVVG
jgi:hypothetical protein